MKVLHFIIISTILFSCSEKETEPLEVQLTEELSECMEEKMVAFEENGLICESGAVIAQYNYQDSLVYLFSPGICIADGMTEVTNNRCEAIGFLGGIDGSSEVNGEEFWSNSEFVENIWEN
jgi:hypothetical protein